jgi:hypothetical protein
MLLLPTMTRATRSKGKEGSFAVAKKELLMYQRIVAPALLDPGLRSGLNPAAAVARPPLLPLLRRLLQLLRLFGVE